MQGRSYLFESGTSVGVNMRVATVSLFVEIFLLFISHAVAHVTAATPEPMPIKLHRLQLQYSFTITRSPLL